MPNQTPQRPIFLILVFAILPMLGCQNGPQRPVPGGGSSGAGSDPTDDALSNLDLGDDWAEYEQQLSLRNTAGASSASVPNLQGASSSAEQGFAIVLATFGGDTHREQANQFRDRAALLLPDMAPSIRIHPSAGGSLVVCGEYAGWKDPGAKQDVRTLQELTINGVQVFPQAILTELAASRDPNSIDEAELVSLRLRYPDIRVLYTLEIAIWGDFDSGQWPEATRRRAAEQYARTLRQRGVPAFYHHDAARQMSMVTVGVFDHRAIDGQTGLPSPQVERFLMDFPERRVNGEQILDLYDPSDPSKGGRPQQPRVVEVPTL